MAMDNLQNTFVERALHCRDTRCDDVWSTSFIITASAMENKINTMNSTLPIRLRVQNHSRYFQTILELQRGCNNQQYKCQSSYYNLKIASAVWDSPCSSTYILFGQIFPPCSSSAVPLHMIEINKACSCRTDAKKLTLQAIGLTYWVTVIEMAQSITFRTSAVLREYTARHATVVLSSCDWLLPIYVRASNLLKWRKFVYLHELDSLARAGNWNISWITA